MVQVKAEIGECVSLFIPSKDKDKFWKIITDAGYEANRNGVLMYIMETEPADEDWNEELPSAGSIVVDAVHHWAEKNPDQWDSIKRKGSAVTRSLIGKIISKL